MRPWPPCGWRGLWDLKAHVLSGPRAALLSFPRLLRVVVKLQVGKAELKVKKANFMRLRVGSEPFVIRAQEHLGKGSERQRSLLDTLMKVSDKGIFDS